jgi:hypothetical protein
LGKECDGEEYMERDTFRESIKAMAEEMELKWASWGNVPDRRMWAQQALSTRQYDI